MAPLPLRKPVAKDRFPTLFSTLKTQVYHDPASRGPGSHTIRTIAWNPTGQLIATGSADRTLRVWNPDKPQVKNSTELRGHTGGIERVAWNPVKEAELASVSSDGTCRFWDVRNKICTAIVQLGEAGLTVCYSADGESVMVGRRPIQTNQILFSYSAPPSHLLLTRGDGSVSILSYPSLNPLHSLSAHTSSCLSLALSPTGRYLAIGGSDALVSLYDTSDWVCKRTITSPVGAVKSVGFSFDGSYVIAGCDENANLEVTHVETGDVVGTIPLGTGVGGGQIAWHPGRYWIAFAGDGGGLRILGAAGGQL
ncbi:uncharacterized protein KY384_002026 [Bacidia gigantensis]|uniref:uncharacterized protein n=1 Tax=Bacidia gigantensis TaxID=2732470 RepID=UPI001D052A0A|nr:uncharacterized protein KY384_002026 [Bacidia gigantensis]KAG8533243.1 hypothetical protein KY384_002026 [Bacidia gigantensis]